MAGIEDLKSKVSLRNGMAMSHQFAVTLPPKAGISSEEMNILVKETEIPGKQIMTSDRAIGIHTEKVANGFAVADLNMTFYVTNNYGPRKYFDAWMNTMVNEDNGAIAYKKGADGINGGYTDSITIHQLSKPQVRVGFDIGILDVNFDLLGNSIYSVELQDAFPTTVNAIQLSNDGQFVELQVTFAYTKFKVKKDSRGLSDLIDTKLGINLGGII